MKIRPNNELHLFKKEEPDSLHIFARKEVDNLHLFKQEVEESPIELYTEFSHNHIKKIQSGEYEMEIPEGTTMKHIKGTRRFTFTCVNKEIAEMVKDALDIDGIVWQEI